MHKTIIDGFSVVVDGPRVTVGKESRSETLGLVVRSGRFGGVPVDPRVILRIQEWSSAWL